MGRLSRAGFLRLSAGLAGVPLLEWFRPEPVLAQTSTPVIEPDMIVVNARVYTVDSALPRAEAFAIKDGRFTAVGSTRDIRNLATRRTRILDAERATITPGFIDAHCHPSGVNELYEVNANLRSIREIQQALRERADKTPKGFWITGVMFDDTKLSEGRALNRRDLDEVSREHPIAVNHRGGHTSWYNSKAFELAEVNKSTPDPDHGRFFRDADGELSGRAAELARNVFRNVGDRPKFTAEEIRERARNGMRYISELLTSTGLTSVHDAGADADRIRAYEDTHLNGELRHRAWFMIRGAEVVSAFKTAGIYSGFGNEFLRVGAIKFAADGSASERTMRMSTPYVGTDDYGILTMTQAELDEAVLDAHAHRFRIGVHANGDVTIDMVLKAYEKAFARYPDADRRHRLEHCSLVNPDLLARIKKLGCIPTPFWTYIYYHGEKWGMYGDEKMRWMFAHRSFLDYGIPVPGASDYGPGPFEPLMAIQSMVTRKDYKGREWGTNQRVTIDEALRIGTINGAYASKEEHVKGSITPGKYADFVMLEKDPHDVPPDTIKDIKIVRTVVGGRTVFPKEG